MPFSGDWGRGPKAAEAVDQVVSCAHAHHGNVRRMCLFPSRSPEEPQWGTELGTHEGAKQGGEGGGVSSSQSSRDHRPKSLEEPRMDFK